MKGACKRPPSLQAKTTDMAKALATELSREKLTSALERASKALKKKLADLFEPDNIPSIVEELLRLDLVGLPRADVAKDALLDLSLRDEAQGQQDVRDQSVRRKTNASQLKSGDYDAESTYGFVVIQGDHHTIAVGTVNAFEIKFNREFGIANKHGRGGQSQNRFARLAEESRQNHLRADSSPIVDAIVVAGPGPMKADFVDSLPRRWHPLTFEQTVTTTQAGQTGLQQLVAHMKEACSTVSGGPEPPHEGRRVQTPPFFASQDNKDMAKALAQKLSREKLTSALERASKALKKKLADLFEPDNIPSIEDEDIELKTVDVHSLRQDLVGLPRADVAKDALLDLSLRDEAQGQQDVRDQSVRRKTNASQLKSGDYDAESTYGFVVIQGDHHTIAVGTVNAFEIKFNREFGIANKHGRGGQSQNRFARLAEESRQKPPSGRLRAHGQSISRVGLLSYRGRHRGGRPRTHESGLRGQPPAPLAPSDLRADRDHHAGGPDGAAAAGGAHEGGVFNGGPEPPHEGRRVQTPPFFASQDNKDMAKALAQKLSREKLTSALERASKALKKKLADLFEPDNIPSIVEELLRLTLWGCLGRTSPRTRYSICPFGFWNSSRRATERARTPALKSTYGFVVIQGDHHTIAVGTVNAFEIKFNREFGIANKHGRGGQSQNRFARLAEESRQNHLRADSSPIVDAIVVAGPGPMKADFVDSLPRRWHPLTFEQTVTTTQAGQTGLQQLVAHMKEACSTVRPRAAPMKADACKRPPSLQAKTTRTWRRRWHTEALAREKLTSALERASKALKKKLADLFEPDNIPSIEDEDIELKTVDVHSLRQDLVGLLGADVAKDALLDLSLRDEAQETTGRERSVGEEEDEASQLKSGDYDAESTYGFVVIQGDHHTIAVGTVNAFEIKFNREFGIANKAWARRQSQNRFRQDSSPIVDAIVVAGPGPMKADFVDSLPRRWHPLTFEQTVTTTQAGQTGLQQQLVAHMKEACSTIRRPRAAHEGRRVQTPPFFASQDNKDMAQALAQKLSREKLTSALERASKALKKKLADLFEPDNIPSIVEELLRRSSRTTGRERSVVRRKTNASQLKSGDYDAESTYGFVVIQGDHHTIAVGTVNAFEIKFQSEFGIANKHGRGGQSQNRFARLAEESRQNHLRAVYERMDRAFLG
ncbi:eukaryotic release factor 1 [Penaeus vannamei]|uniref:Eukaryotic release factor 1 n=1 Tax=Penaeus vannamei TaxID=6689 RepID=A0A3R7PDV5_PENVA|nr:eukaryotic release factor 1 [Penaeus vannamei]